MVQPVVIIGDIMPLIVLVLYVLFCCSDSFLIILSCLNEFSMTIVAFQCTTWLVCYMHGQLFLRVIFGKDQILTQVYKNKVCAHIDFFLRLCAEYHLSFSYLLWSRWRCICCRCSKSTHQYKPQRSDVVERELKLSMRHVRRQKKV